MSSKPKVVASGGVVLREHKGEKQVLIIHRDRYDDWSLPKGKGKADELHPETAIREIQEETGILARLDLRLPSVTYKVSKGKKVCHFWRATVAQEGDWSPNSEVDGVRWASIPEARTLLTYETDLEVLQSALDAPESTALLLVRHGKAMQRKHWTGKDQKRQLSSRGRSQAKALRSLLAAFGVERTVSSSSTRCMETLAPYAKQRGLDLEGVDLLSEEEAEEHPTKVVRFMGHMVDDLEVPTAVCGHRPVLPHMFDGLSAKNRAMVVGEAIAMHYDRKGTLLSVDVFKPTA